MTDVLALPLHIQHALALAGAYRPRLAVGGVPGLLPEHLAQALRIAGAGRWHNALAGRPHFEDGGDAGGGDNGGDNEGGYSGGYGVNNSGGVGGSVTGGTAGVSSEGFGGGYANGSVTSGGYSGGYSGSGDGWGSGSSGGLGFSGGNTSTSMGAASDSVGGYSNSVGSIGGPGDSVAGTVSSPGFSNFGASDASNTEDGLNGNNSFSPTQGHFVGSMGASQQGSIGGFTDHSNNSYGDSGNGFGGLSNGFGGASQGDAAFGGFDGGDSLGGFSVSANGGYGPAANSFGGYSGAEDSGDTVSVHTSSLGPGDASVGNIAGATASPFSGSWGSDTTGDPGSVDGMHALTVHGADTGFGFGSFEGADQGISSAIGGYQPGAVGSIAGGQVSTPTTMGFDNFGSYTPAKNSLLGDDNTYSVPGYSQAQELSNQVQDPGTYFGSQYPSLVGKTFSPGFAAGLLGNFSVESGGYSAARPDGLKLSGVNPKSYAFGLAQDLAERRDGLYDALGIPAGTNPYAAAQMTDGTLPNQLAYSLNEIATDPQYGKTLAAALNPSTTPAQATSTVLSNFEKPSPADQISSLPNRNISAAAWASNLAKAQALANANPGVTSIGSPYSYGAVGPAVATTPNTSAPTGLSPATPTGTIGDLANGSLTGFGSQVAGLDASNLSVAATGGVTPTKAAEDAGFSNAALATGVAAAAEQAVGVPGMLGKLASDPGYADVRSAIENGQSPVEVAHTLADALGNDPAAIKSMLATGIGIDTGALAKSIDANTTAAGQQSAPTASQTADLPGGLASLAGNDGTSTASAPTSDYSINGQVPDEAAPSAYAADGTLPASVPSITVHPATIAPATATPAQQAQSLWSEAHRNSTDSIGSKAAQMGINAAVGMVPGLGLVNGLSSLLGGPNVGALIAHTAQPGSVDSAAMSRAAGTSGNGSQITPQQMSNAIASPMSSGDLSNITSAVRSGAVGPQVAALQTALASGNPASIEAAVAALRIAATGGSTDASTAASTLTPAQLAYQTASAHMPGSQDRYTAPEASPLVAPSGLVAPTAVNPNWYNPLAA